MNGKITQIHTDLLVHELIDFWVLLREPKHNMDF